jgi:hypothetical protein
LNLRLSSYLGTQLPSSMRTSFGQNRLSFGLPATKVAK